MKAKNIFQIGLFLLLLNSCSDSFLDLSPFTSQNSGNFYKTEEQMLQAVNGAYSNLQGYANRAYVLEEMRSDNATIDNAQDAGGLGRYTPITEFYLSTDNKFVLSAWRKIYNAVADINMPLSKLPGADIKEATKKRFEGELKFLRAFFYYVAVNYWGEIPLVTTTLNASEAFAIGKSDVNTIYQAIISDLQDAANSLPASYSDSEDIGRATKGAAYALLGKVYLTLKDYDNAITVLRKVQGYSLVANYADIFDPAHENGPESIFEVQYMEGPYNQYSNFQYQFAPFKSKTVVDPAWGAPYGANMPTNDFLKQYEEGDLRKDATVGFETMVEDYTGNNLTIAVPYVKKYNHPHAVIGQTGNNWVILRYADVMLMLAEALNEKGYSTGEPFDLINTVRNRAGLANLTPNVVAGQAAFRSAVEKERRVELAFENQRWFDLLRSGHALETMRAFGASELANPTTPINPVSPPVSVAYQIEGYELLLPIPDAEIIINDIGQNPGY